MKRAPVLRILFVTAFVSVITMGLSALAAGPAPDIARPFGKMPDGTEVMLYTLRNRQGFEAQITNYGAILVSLKTPDRSGKLADVVLGYDDLDGYLHGRGYFGATIGRYGNRIAKGAFNLNGETYHLATNNGVNHLHGGTVGFNRVVWQAKPISPESIEFSYTSKDGEENYPGTLSVKVTYTVTEKNELKIDYAAQEAPGKDTIVNLTNHSYFNLTGDPRNAILNHQLMINATRFTPTDAGQIPTGELRPVKGTAFDFTTSTKIGARIDQEDEQLKMGKGYDHNWVVDRKQPGLVLAAELFDPQSGRVMQVLTTEPGIQFYSGNNLNGKEKGKEGIVYAFRSGLALETQHYPDSPNHPNFPTTTLKAGQRYTSTTVYRFSVR
jgi:aldose 1-epimerase